jgi:hypothetical protein
MALFKAVPGRRDLIYDTYSRNIAVDPLPKYQLPNNQSLPSTVYSLIHDELLLDGNSRQNLATFCTTFVSPEAQQLMQECVDKNLIDRMSTRKRPRSSIAACIFWPICGMRPKLRPHSAARRPVPRKPRCSAGWH